jgi:hypothetical protein
MRGICLAIVLSGLSAGALQAQSVEEHPRQYVSLAQGRQMTDQMFSPASMAAKFANGLLPNVAVSADQLDRIGLLLSDELQTLRPALDAAMIAAGARLFNAKELPAPIVFYRAQHGTAMMA